MKELNDLDDNLVDNHRDNIKKLVKDRVNMVGDLWNAFNIKEGMLRLKLRKMWLQEDDRNTYFFHNYLKGQVSEERHNYGG